MDPKLPAGSMIFAPPADGGGGGYEALLPGRDRPPRLDERLVLPEARDEIIRGRRVTAMPANPPHSDRHFGLDYVVGAHLGKGYVGSTDLLTRTSQSSDFATDTCIRKAGIDPATGTRHLEELAFEVVNEQSLKDITERAEELIARGVRRVFALFVKKGEVCEWSGGAFRALDPDASIRDATLCRPLGVKALLDAAEADDAVAGALLEKQNRVLAQATAAALASALARSKAEAVLAVLAARGLPASAALREELLATGDLARLDRWIAAAAVASSADELGRVG